MMLKIIGSLIVIVMSSLLGFMYSRDFEFRPRELRELQSLLQILENEISFLSNLLTDSFERVCKSSTGNSAEFFRQALCNLKSGKGLNASEAWEMAVKDEKIKTSLNKEDKEILASFGKLLGNSDLESQVKNIRLTISQLKNQEQKAEESRKKNAKMYKSLGALAGIAIVIILF